MKVLFDHQIFSWQRFGGISRYFAELYNQLPNYNVIAELAIRISKNEYLQQHQLNGIAKILDICDQKNHFALLANKHKSIDLIKRQQFDVFHPTQFKTYFLDYLGTKPFVLTIYDMIDERMKDSPFADPVSSKRKKLLCEKCRKIIAISESTKQDIIQFFGIDESKIEVIHLGTSVKPDQSKGFCLEKEYLLFVGARIHYKNFQRMISACAAILKEKQNLILLCIGGGRFSKNEEKLFNNLGIPNKVKQFSAAENQMYSIYHNAAALVYPSLYEGFGIPVAEAFSSGCPALLSDIAVFREIANSAALYFNPQDEASIASCVRKVIYDKKLRDSLAARGAQMAPMYTWEQTAEKTATVYKNII